PPSSLFPYTTLFRSRACVDAEDAVAHLFEADSNAVAMHGLERQRFQNEHVQSALDEITWLVCHGSVPPEGQEEAYASPPDCQEESWNYAVLSVARIG